MEYGSEPSAVNGDPKKKVTRSKTSLLWPVAQSNSILFVWLQQSPPGGSKPNPAPRRPSPKPREAAGSLAGPAACQPLPTPEVTGGHQCSQAPGEARLPEQGSCKGLRRTRTGLGVGVRVRLAQWERRNLQFWPPPCSPCPHVSCARTAHTLGPRRPALGRGASQAPTPQLASAGTGHRQLPASSPATRVRPTFSKPPLNPCAG